ncbi:hypothetical protein ACJX0J_031292, partial [Zea mays]
AFKATWPWYFAFLYPYHHLKSPQQHFLFGLMPSIFYKKIHNFLSRFFQMKLMKKIVRNQNRLSTGTGNMDGDFPHEISNLDVDGLEKGMCGSFLGIVFACFVWIVDIWSFMFNLTLIVMIIFKECDLLFIGWHIQILRNYADRYIHLL